MDTNYLPQQAGEQMRSLMTDQMVQAGRAVVWVSCLQAQQEHAPSGFAVPVSPGMERDGSSPVPEFEPDPAPERYRHLAQTLVVVAAGRFAANADWTMYETYLAHLAKQTEITRHETVAQLNAMNLTVGADLLHLGMTSSDATEPAVAAIFDTATVLTALRLHALGAKTAGYAADQAEWTVAGRTHGVLAAPITWGQRWAAATEALMQASRAAVDAAPLRARRPGAGPVHNHAGWWQMGADGAAFTDPDGGAPGSPEHRLSAVTCCAAGRIRLGMDDLYEAAIGIRPYGTPGDDGGPEPEIIGEEGSLSHAITLAGNRAWAQQYSPEGVGYNVEAYNAPGTQQLPHHGYTKAWAALDQAALAVRKITRDLRLAIALGEAHVVRAPGQTGSSAMPHKANPILLERAAALSHVVTGYTNMARESAESWLEGDVAESASRKVWLPGMFLAVDAMLIALYRGLDTLVVNPITSEIVVTEHWQELGTFDELTRRVKDGVGRSYAHTMIANNGIDPATKPSTGLSYWTAHEIGVQLRDGLTDNPARWE